MCILYSLCTNTLPHHFDMWRLKNCYCFVDRSYTCWQCENLVKLLCFDLIFRIKVSGHCHACNFSFLLPSMCLFICGTAEFCRKAFPLPSNCCTCTYKWAFLDSSFFHYILCKLKLFCHSLKNVCDCCKLNDVIAVGMLASYLHPSFIVWYNFRHNLIA